MPDWMPIDGAPTDGRMVWVYAPGREELPPILALYDQAIALAKGTING